MIERKSLAKCRAQETVYYKLNLIIRANSTDVRKSLKFDIFRRQLYWNIDCEGTYLPNHK